MAAKIERGVARLIDANLNRAREGLRVVEDTARFIWSDAAAYRRLRRIRHELHDLTKGAYRALVAARDSAADSGRTVVEGSKRTLSGVVSANLRRAQEAVRVLEEYSKVFAGRSAAGFKAIRFRLYQEEKRILKKL